MINLKRTKAVLISCALVISQLPLTSFTALATEVVGNGVVKQEYNWQEENGKLYCKDTSGNLVKEQWVSTDGKWRYVTSDGSAITGWVKYQETWYYIGQDYNMVTGAFSAGGKKYYTGPSGVMVANEWGHDVDGDWVYLGADGAAVTGWIKYLNTWYYMDENAKMVHDTWKTIDGKEYHFNNTGAMAVNTFVGDDFVDQNGAKVGSGFSFSNNNKDNLNFDTGEELTTEEKNALLQGASYKMGKLPTWLNKYIYSEKVNVTYEYSKDDFGIVDDGKGHHYEKFAIAYDDFIKFTNEDAVLVGVGIFVNATGEYKELYKAPSERSDFNQIFLEERSEIEDLIDNDPVYDGSKVYAWAECFALYYGSQKSDFKENCPKMYKFVEGYMKTYKTTINRIKEDEREKEKEEKKAQAEKEKEEKKKNSSSSSK